MDYSELYGDEVMEFRRGLTPETDRGCALMAAAYLDEQLRRLLRAAMVDDEKAVDALLRPHGGLDTFSSRIEICYSLGLISPCARRDLHLIRKIRNEFAHTASPKTFEDDEIAHRCDELHHAFLVVTGRMRAKFTNAALGVCGQIHSALVHTEHALAAPDLNPTEEQRRELRRRLEASLPYGDSSDLSGASGADA